MGSRRRGRRREAKNSGAETTMSSADLFPLRSGGRQQLGLRHDAHLIPSVRSCSHDRIINAIRIERRGRQAHSHLITKKRLASD